MNVKKKPMKKAIITERKNINYKFWNTKHFNVIITHSVLYLSKKRVIAWRNNIVGIHMTIHSDKGTSRWQI